jgi:hypothetical protein
LVWIGVLDAVHIHLLGRALVVVVVVVVIIVIVRVLSFLPSCTSRRA